MLFKPGACIGQHVPSFMKSLLYRTLVCVCVRACACARVRTLPRLLITSGMISSATFQIQFTALAIYAIDKRDARNKIHC